ncbi:MAG: hypothetical protein U0Z44_02825 [Kouleothrix sp.]
MRIGVLCSRVRVEEKLLFQEMDRRGLDYVRIDDDAVIFHLNEGHYPYDIVLERSIHHSRALYALKALNDAGVPTVNTAAVADVCGDKFKTTQALIKHGVPTPRQRWRYTVKNAGSEARELPGGAQAGDRLVGPPDRQGQRPRGGRGAART